MNCFLGLILLCLGYSLIFSQRNNTHLLFDYTFLQNECENGSFSPNEYEEGFSFGELITKESLQCLKRSGYQSMGYTSGYAFESNATIESYLSRINDTQEFSIEVWLYSGEQSYVIVPYISFSVVNDLLSMNNASFLIENYDILHAVYSIDMENKQRAFYVNNQPFQYAHYILTFKQYENYTQFQSFINGTLARNMNDFRINLNAWDKNSRMYGSYPRSYLSSFPRWRGEVYYLGFYDHALSSEQIQHNFYCSIPPSIPSIQETILHGDMNTRFILPLQIYDHNVNTQTNLFDGYSVNIWIQSLPHRGTLYTSSMEPITNLPPSGRMCNMTLYYQPVEGEYSLSVYSQFNITIENNYGMSNPITLSIFVDWVNSAPIVPPKNFQLSTHQSLLVDIDVIDVDNDKNYTRILSVSPACLIPQDFFFYNFSFPITFVGGNTTCFVELVVGDSHGMESNTTIFSFTVINQIEPLVTLLEVYQGANITFSLTYLNVDFIIINNTNYGTVQVYNQSSLIYITHPYYFSHPSHDIHGNNLHNPDQSFQYRILHKGILSPVFTLQIIIHHVNTPPSLHFPSSLQFPVYTPVLIPNISITDNDLNTQLCTLRITTTTGFFIFNTTVNDSLEWKEGNYGEGMDDNLLVVQGSIDALNDALQLIQYRAVYKLNDSMIITLMDGEYNVTGKIALLYQTEKIQLSSQFQIIVMIVVAILIVILFSCVISCLNKCMKCKKSKKTKKSKKQLPITKKNNQDSLPKKKTPPPPPSSLPPIKHKQDITDTIETISKKSEKPPSVQ